MGRFVGWSISWNGGAACVEQITFGAVGFGFRFGMFETLEVTGDGASELGLCASVALAGRSHACFLSD